MRGAGTGTLSVEMHGNRFTGSSLVFTNVTQNCIWDILTDGTNRLVSGTWFTVTAGTPVFTLHGWELAVDPIAFTTLAASVGQYINSTRATVSCQGPAILTGAGWCALATGTSAENVVIT